MKIKKKTSRKWRLNYVIVYSDAQKADIFRNFVHNATITAATLRKIDYAIEADTRRFDKTPFDADSLYRDSVTDLVYFRSSSDSLSSVKEFRVIVDSLFRNYYISYNIHFEVFAQISKALKEFPFPKEFWRPLTFPYMEYHSGKKSTLCIPKSTLVNLLVDEIDSKRNLN